MLQVMDVLLNELCLNLDEDMKDFDEYELGLTDLLLNNGHYDDQPVAVVNQLAGWKMLTTKNKKDFLTVLLLYLF